jgi:hypothetical protein
MKITEISCQCGSVKAQISGEPLEQFYCHCAPCQADSGGAYVSVATYPIDNVTVTQGEPTVYNNQFRCPTCGTHLLTKVPEVGQTGVKVNLLPEGVFTPTFHQHCSDAVLPVQDSLPHYISYPPQFGGNGATVPW